MEMQMMQNSQNNLAKDKVGELAPHDFKASYSLEQSRQSGAVVKTEKEQNRLKKYTHTHMEN